MSRWETDGEVESSVLYVLDDLSRDSKDRQKRAQALIDNYPWEIFHWGGGTTNEGKPLICKTNNVEAANAYIKYGRRWPVFNRRGEFIRYD